MATQAQATASRVNIIRYNTKRRLKKLGFFNSPYNANLEEEIDYYIEGLSIVVAQRLYNEKKISDLPTTDVNARLLNNFQLR